MALERYAQFLQRYLTLLWACLVVVLVMAAAFRVRLPLYTAKSTIYIGGRRENPVAPAYDGSRTALLPAHSYPQLVSNVQVSSKVVACLGPGEFPELVEKQITAQNMLDSIVLNAAVTESSPTEAARIANTVHDIFKSLVEQLKTMRNTCVDVGEELMVQRATASAKPSLLSLPKMLALGLAAGLLGTGAATARQEKIRVQASRTSANDIPANPLENCAKGTSITRRASID